MKKIITNIFLYFSICSCYQRRVDINYEVDQKKEANFSVVCPELYPKEKLQVKINNSIILNVIGDDTTGSHSFWRCFYFPNNINTVEIDMYYKGNKKFHKVFHDTLNYAKNQSIIISRTFPKGMTKQTYRPYGFVPMDSAERKIMLVDDSVYYKGMRLY